MIFFKKDAIVDIDDKKIEFKKYSIAELPEFQTQLLLSNNIVELYNNQIVTLGIDGEPDSYEVAGKTYKLLNDEWELVE